MRVCQWLSVLGLAACGGTAPTLPTIEGSALGEVLRGRAASERMRGRAGDDTLAGGAGNDRLHGGDGADVLHGGPGHDVLEGGAGADRFVIERADLAQGTAPDRIVDFTPHEGDRIQLRGFGPLAPEDPLRIEHGIVSVRLRGGRYIPVVDIGRPRLKVRLESDRSTITILGQF